MAEKLHNRLRSSRAAVGYTQASIAKMLGISKNTYINYEKGITEIPAKTLNKFATLCLQSVNWLHTGENKIVLASGNRVNEMKFEYNDEERKLMLEEIGRLQMRVSALQNENRHLKILLDEECREKKTPK